MTTVRRNTVQFVPKGWRPTIPDREYIVQARTWDPPLRGCQMCGRTLYTQAGRPYLLVFKVKTDSGREWNIEGAFCKLTCMRRASM